MKNLALIALVFLFGCRSSKVVYGHENVAFGTEAAKNLKPDPSTIVQLSPKGKEAVQ
jgi:hypothetical protein